MQHANSDIEQTVPSERRQFHKRDISDTHVLSLLLNADIFKADRFVADLYYLARIAV